MKPVSEGMKRYASRRGAPERQRLEDADEEERCRLHCRPKGKLIKCKSRPIVRKPESLLWWGCEKGGTEGRVKLHSLLADYTCTSDGLGQLKRGGVKLAPFNHRAGNAAWQGKQFLVLS